MNRMQTVTAMVWLDQIAAHAKAVRDQLRGQLDADAAREYETGGTVPTWRIPDVATVSGSVSKQTIGVTDEAAFTDWVQERYPDAIRTLATVRAGWRERFLETAQVDGDDVSDPDTGEVIPGLTVRRGGRFLGVSVRATVDAKGVLGIAAVEGLKHAATLAGPNMPIVLAELEPARHEVQP